MDSNPIDILLLEDHALVRAGVRGLIELEEPHARVKEVATYEQAVEQIQQHRFDIAFLDYDLRSTRNGFHVLEFIKSNKPKILVVMVSVVDDEVTIAKCLDAGASGYITKDQDESGIFTQALSTVLSGGIFLPKSITKTRRTPIKGSAVNPIFGLSDRQTQVLKLLCRGMPNKLIASQMGIKEGTVRKEYISPLLSRFRVRNRTELVIEVSRLRIGLAM